MTTKEIVKGLLEQLNYHQWCYEMTRKSCSEIADKEGKDNDLYRAKHDVLNMDFGAINELESQLTKILADTTYKLFYRYDDNNIKKATIARNDIDWDEIDL